MTEIMKRFRPLKVLLVLDRYYPEMHRGIADFASRNGWHLNCEMAISGRLPVRWSGDGILTLVFHRKELIRFIRKSSIPSVDLSMEILDLDVPRVCADNAKIGEMAGLLIMWVLELLMSATEGVGSSTQIRMEI